MRGVNNSPSLHICLCICAALLTACASRPVPQNLPSGSAGTSTTPSKAEPPTKQSSPAQPAQPSNPAQTTPPGATSSPIPGVIPSVTPSATNAVPVPLAANPLAGAEGATQRGLASWYGPSFQGRRTASGERFDAGAMTAAHKSFAFGTRVLVRSLSSGKEVVVRINDRGPFAKDRIIDLSHAAARVLGISGVQQVEIRRLD